MSQNAGRSTFKLGLYPFKYRDFLGIMAQKLNNFSQRTQKMFQVYLWSKNCQKFEFQELDCEIRVNMDRLYRSKCRQKPYIIFEIGLVTNNEFGITLIRILYWQQFGLF